MQKLKYYGSVILFFIVVGALGFGTSYVQRPHNVVIGVNLALSGEEKAYGEPTARRRPGASAWPAIRSTPKAACWTRP